MYASANSYVFQIKHIINFRALRQLNDVFVHKSASSYLYKYIYNKILFHVTFLKITLILFLLLKLMKILDYFNYVIRHLYSLFRSF